MVVVGTTDAREGSHTSPLFPRPYYDDTVSGVAYIVGTGGGVDVVWGPSRASVVLIAPGPMSARFRTPSVGPSRASVVLIVGVGWIVNVSSGATF